MKLAQTFLILFAITLFNSGHAANYIIDTKGMHAAIQFKVKHLGFSWLLGRFDEFEGTFSFDEKQLSQSKVSVTINTDSVNSNHAERDKHLRSSDFLNTKKFPKATFVSKSVSGTLDNMMIKGDFTLNGVTKELTIKAKAVGGGKSPWKDYRYGFEGETSFKMKDFNFKKSLGPASEEVYLSLHVEGIQR